MYQRKNNGVMHISYHVYNKRELKTVNQTELNFRYQLSTYSKNGETHVKP
jgi:hypothetical protein